MKLKAGIIKNVALMIVISAVFCAATPIAHAEETSVNSPSFFSNPLKLIFKKIDERRENKEINKNVRNELIEKQIISRQEIKESPKVQKTFGFSDLVAELSSTTQKMNSIALRLDSRIKKIESDGVDLTHSRLILNEAVIPLKTANENITFVLDITASTTAATSTPEIKAAIEKTLRAINETQKIFEKTTRSINETINESGL
jgi:hypothetical protein